jgi:hypothetical protein
MCLDRFIDFGSWPSLGRQLTLPPREKVAHRILYIYIYWRMCNIVFWKKKGGEDIRRAWLDAAAAAEAALFLFQYPFAQSWWPALFPDVGNILPFVRWLYSIYVRVLAFILFYFFIVSSLTWLDNLIIIENKKKEKGYNRKLRALIRRRSGHELIALDLGYKYNGPGSVHGQQMGKKWSSSHKSIRQKDHV